MTIGSIVRLKDWEELSRKIHKGEVKLKCKSGSFEQFHIGEPLILKKSRYYADGLHDVLLSPVSEPAVEFTIAAKIPDDFVVDLLAQVRYRVDAKRREKIRS